jgi:phosphatidylglycerophosphate synthase
MVKQRQHFKETSDDMINYYIYEPVVLHVENSSMSPNSISIFRAFIIFFVFCFLILYKDFILKYRTFTVLFLFVFIFFICGVSDDLDGYVARRYNKKSKKGDVLDKFVDKFLSFVMIFCTYYYIGFKNFIFILPIYILFFINYILLKKKKTNKLRILLDNAFLFYITVFSILLFTPLIK